MSEEYWREREEFQSTISIQISTQASEGTGQRPQISIHDIHTDIDQNRTRQNRRVYGFQSTISIQISTIKKKSQNDKITISIHDIHTDIDEARKRTSAIDMISIHDIHTDIDSKAEGRDMDLCKISIHDIHTDIDSKFV